MPAALLRPTGFNCGDYVIDHCHRISHVGIVKCARHGGEFAVGDVDCHFGSDHGELVVVGTREEATRYGDFVEAIPHRLHGSGAGLAQRRCPASGSASGGAGIDGLVDSSAKERERRPLSEERFSADRLEVVGELGIAAPPFGAFIHLADAWRCPNSDQGGHRWWVVERDTQRVAATERVADPDRCWHSARETRERLGRAGNIECWRGVTTVAGEGRRVVRPLWSAPPQFGCHATPRRPGLSETVKQNHVHAKASRSLRPDA